MKNTMTMVLGALCLALCATCMAMGVGLDGAVRAAKGTRVTMTDTEPPTDKAFYRVEVSVPTTSRTEILQVAE